MDRGDVGKGSGLLEEQEQEEVGRGGEGASQRAKTDGMEGGCGRRNSYRLVYSFYSSMCPRKNSTQERVFYLRIKNAFIGGMQSIHRIERCAIAARRHACERKRERVLGVLTLTFDGGRVEQSFSRPKLCRGQRPRQRAKEARALARRRSALRWGHRANKSTNRYLTLSTRRPMGSERTAAEPCRASAASTERQTEGYRSTVRTSLFNKNTLTSRSLRTSEPDGLLSRPEDRIYIQIYIYRAEGTAVTTADERWCVFKSPEQTREAGGRHSRHPLLGQITRSTRRRRHFSADEDLRARVAQPVPHAQVGPLDRL